MDAGGGADALLRAALGPDAAFRDGQREAIVALVAERARLLVVQRTGWGKSLVYFLATRLLRDAGSGPTLIISPLLSLMSDQQLMARRLGIAAAHIASDNTAAWDGIEHDLRCGAIDVLFVSPERLANERFRTETLPAILGNVGMLVVDEAHCISDWGHDFRPDYRRIATVARNLPSSVPLLGTTATANDRVVADIAEQLGPGLRTVRGPLARRSLRLQATAMPDPADRLAWLATTLPTLPGSGIVYTLTVADAEQVARWLRDHGIEARAYHGSVGEAAGLQEDERQGLRRRLEDDLRHNRVKALVATVALGMGFDKPDLGFVIHYQRPGSIVAYYQQVGRAGRAIDDALAILLEGREDDEVSEYFFSRAFPSADEQAQVLASLEDDGPLTLGELQARVNMSKARIEGALKFFEVDGIAARDGRDWLRTPRMWSPNHERSQRITSQRHAELRQMKEFVRHTGCLMEFVAHTLDDPEAKPCGACAGCLGRPLVPTDIDPRLADAARRFLQRADVVLEPRRMLPHGALPAAPWRKIPDHLRAQPGRALCYWGDGGWGDSVRDGKYGAGRFADDLVAASAELVRDRWRPNPTPRWLTTVPSSRHGAVLEDFARRLAAALAIQFVPTLQRSGERPPQKEMANSVQQAENVAGSIAVLRAAVQPEPVLLVDDMVDSGWTLTAAAMKLSNAGSGPVFPFALAKVRA
jgi:ATP-dependent DNA helicase RecQ